MKRFLWVIIPILFLCVSGEQAFAQDNMVKAVTKIEKEISTILQELGKNVALSAEEMGKIEPYHESKVRKLLQQSWSKGKPHAITSAFIDSKGVLKIIEPDNFRQYEGSDVSKQEAVLKMLKTNKPRMGNLFLSVEGIKSVDIEYPAFSGARQFLGSVSMMIKPDEVIRSLSAPVEKEMGVKCWVMQDDGLILYDTDKPQIGRNLFTDPLSKSDSELIALGKRMVQEKEGNGFYTFRTQVAKNIFKKEARWKTIHFFNNDWIVVVYKEVKQ